MDECLENNVELKRNIWGGAYMLEDKKNNFEVMRAKFEAEKNGCKVIFGYDS